MEKIYAPWRSKYTIDTARDFQDCDLENNCVFCRMAAETDKDKGNFMLFRGEHNFVALNLYPYNAGHLMVVPYRHLSSLDSIGKKARIELMELANAYSERLTKRLDADGINIGLNLGRSAGAGLPCHLHMHVLPRWNGDTNFLPLLSGTKQVSVSLHDIYDTLVR